MSSYPPYLARDRAFEFRGIGMATCLQNTPFLNKNVISYHLDCMLPVSRCMLAVLVYQITLQESVEVWITQMHTNPHQRQAVWRVNMVELRLHAGFLCPSPRRFPVPPGCMFASRVLMSAVLRSRTHKHTHTQSCAHAQQT